MMDFNKVLALIAAMNREGVEYITFGALALNAHGVIRATTDADFFIKPDAQNIERLKTALRSVWNDPEIEHIDAAELMGDYPAVQYGPPDEEFSIDFLTRLGEAYHYDQLEWEILPLDEVPVRVVTARVLYQMKANTVRDKDKVDARTLKAHLGLEEE